MSLEKAKNYLKKFNLDDRIVIHESVTDTVHNAALMLGCSDGEIAKTMSFIVDDKPIVIVMSGEAKISNSKYKAFFHAKAKMVDFDMVEEVIGHEVGGVCPFGVNDGVSIYLDNSLKKYDYVYAAAGEMDATIGLSISELENVIPSASWIDVTNNPMDDVDN